LGWAICCSLWWGDYMMAPFLSRAKSSQHTSSVSDIRARVGWLAGDAGVKDSEEQTNLEYVLDWMRAEAAGNLKAAQRLVDEFEAKVARKRRQYILPGEDQLKKISRYESHLSREMYKALHELEALQTRRAGGAAPFARLDVNVGEPLGEASLADLEH
jgi:hypothetical protein